MRVTHIKIGAVPIHKGQVRFFLAWGGALMMLCDCVWSVGQYYIFPIIHAHFPETIEITLGCCGKTGAAMNGLVLIFEKFFKV